MDIRARAKRIKGLMGGLVHKSEHHAEWVAIERAAERQRPKSMTPHDHEDFAAWQVELERLDREGPGKSNLKSKPQIPRLRA